jgi:hypothetical protein
VAILASRHRTRIIIQHIFILFFVIGIVGILLVENIFVGQSIFILVLRLIGLLCLIGIRISIFSIGAAALRVVRL